MLAIAFDFPAGRYHATPWGRHVNEADVEWPPSPWRLVRALIAIWHRKVPPEERDPETLERLLSALAAEAPHYRVPTAVHAHTRHYMPAKGDKKTLIFDAFARVGKDEDLVMVWPELALEAEQEALLDRLLAGLGFLGRAESWADARRLPEWSGECNCVPGDSLVDTETGEVSEPLSLQVPMPVDEYAGFRQAQLEGMEKRAGLKPRDKRAIHATLPESWVDALAVDTSQLHGAGWSSPPLARAVAYSRPPDLLRPMARPNRSRRTAEPVTTLRFALYGRPLPRIEDAVRMGELLRVAAMSRAKKYCGETSVPAVISGHRMPAGNRHQHAFWLPEDADGDGRIDHFLVHVPGKIEGQGRRAVESLNRLWNREGQEWRIVFENSGTAEELAECGSPLLGESSTFETVIPYLMPWHAKSKFGVEEQIRRECRERGLPEPERIEWLQDIDVAGKKRRPVDFHRFRSKRGLTQPDTQGCFVRLKFPAPLRGPLALGFGCHFGLGLFHPAGKWLRAL